MDGSVLMAFSLTLFAGLATGVGSAIAFLSKRNSPRFLSLALGFSAGVMIYVSMVEILVKARESLSGALGEGPGAWATAGAFFAGMGLIAAIDKLVPEATNPHEAHTVEEMDGSTANRDKHLARMGVATAVAIAIHNFPEGLATFTAAMDNPSMGVAIAVAVAIHNIPEGIAVSVPIFYATKSRKKAFLWSFASGLSEPLGALVGWFLLSWLFSDTMFGLLFAGVAGIMVYISLDELLPTAREYGEHHISMIGLVAGMAVMALSLLLLM